MGLFLIVYSFYIELFDKFMIYGSLFIFLGIVDFMGFLDIGKFLHLIRLKKSEKLKYKQKVIFSQEGIFYKTNDINSHIKWSFYKSFCESKNTLILIFGKRQYSVFPKSSFKDDDYVVLKEFLLENLNK